MAGEVVWSRRERGKKAHARSPRRSRSSFVQGCAAGRQAGNVQTRTQLFGIFGEKRITILGKANTATFTITGVAIECV